jgi:hypothetical protein
VHDADLLAVSLTELDRRGWSLDAYLSSKKVPPDSVVVSLVAASRVRAAERPAASDEFRSRLQHRLAARFQADADRRARLSRMSTLGRIARALTGQLVAPAALTVFALAGAGVMTASSMSHPQSALYPVKAALERVLLGTAVTPHEKIGVRLRLATSRLSEAAEEIRDGHLPAASTLLGDFDRQVAAAQRISGADNQVASLSVVSVGRELALLQSERNRVASKMFGSVLVSNSTATGAAPIAIAAAKLSNAQPGLLSNTQPAPLGSATVIGPLTVAPQATAVAAASTENTSFAAETSRANALSESSQLVFLLLTQVREGDGDAALATARQYASVLQSLSSSSADVINVLRDERETLTAAIPDAPSSTLNALSLALSCVDDALATTLAGPMRLSLPTVPTIVSAPLGASSISPRASSSGDGAPSAPSVQGKVAPPDPNGSDAAPANGSAYGAAGIPNDAPSRPPQTIGRPGGPIGLPVAPIRLPKPVGVVPSPPASLGHPAGPPSVVGNPLVGLPAIVRARARVAAPHKVAGKLHYKVARRPHSKIGK